MPHAHWLAAWCISALVQLPLVSGNTDSLQLVKDTLANS